MIWLTGASGYVGRHVLRRLVERKVPVRYLVLPDDRAPPVTGPSVELVRGDLTQLDSFVRAGEGVDTVVHAAALMLPNPADRIQAVNIGGTASTLRAATQWGARRFVYISAVSAVYETKNVYGSSKARAERMVMESGLAYTILRPTMIYGQDGGLHFQKLVGLIRRAPAVLPILGPGLARLQPVWIEDVATAIELALASPEAVKKTYAVSGQTIVTFNELVDRIMAATGARKMKVHVPLGLCLAVARLVSLVTTHSVLSPDALHGMNQDAAIDYRPFQKDCGYNPISLDEGFARVFEGR